MSIETDKVAGRESREEKVCQRLANGNTAGWQSRIAVRAGRTAAEKLSGAPRPKDCKDFLAAILARIPTDVAVGYGILHPTSIVPWSRWRVARQVPGGRGAADGVCANLREVTRYVHFDCAPAAAYVLFPRRSATTAGQQHG